ncbi:hypothetical protein Trydic_g3923 [Trypoxylus dichotomus]
METHHDRDLKDHRLIGKSSGMSYCYTCAYGAIRKTTETLQRREAVLEFEPGALRLIANRATHWTTSPVPAAIVTSKLVSM